MFPDMLRRLAAGGLRWLLRILFCASAMTVLGVVVGILLTALFIVWDRREHTYDRMPVPR